MPFFLLHDIFLSLAILFIKAMTSTLWHQLEFLGETIRLPMINFKTCFFICSSLNTYFLSLNFRMMPDPKPLPVQFADLAGGSWPAALQIVAALYQRDCNISSGSNGIANERLIEVKMAIGAHAALVLPLARRSVSGDEVGRGKDFLVDNNALYGVFKTKCGGNVAIGCLEAHFWKGLCQLTGVEEYSMEIALTSAKAKHEIEQALMKHDAEYWEREFSNIGVPVTKIVSPEDARSNLERLTGDKLSVDVAMTASSKQTSQESQPSESTSHILQLPRMPLSIGTPSPLPGPKLGSDNDKHF